MRKFINLDNLHILLLILIIVSASINVVQYFYFDSLEKDLETVTSPEVTEGEEVLGETPTGETKILEPSDSIMLFTVQSGDTLIKIFSDAGIASTDAHLISHAINKVYEVAKLKIGHQVEIKFLAESEKNHEYYSKIEFINLIADDTRVEVIFDPRLNEYEAKLVEIPLIRKEAYAETDINGSLYFSALSAGVSPNAIMAFIQLFSYDIDFQRDIKPGDTFEIYYDLYTNHQGQKIRDGNILYAAITISDKKKAIYRFDKHSNTGDYYYSNGENIRKTLLKTPISGAKITSGFGMRKHPILGYSKMHKGLDYAAPRGTPVFAAGDGVVQYIKVTKSGYGKHVEIKHSSKYSTLYAHLDKFASGVRKGRRVSQGDIIGYVGSTGRTTGAHLHYEVHERGKQVNPTKISFSKFPALQGANLQELKNHIKSIESKVAKLKSDKKNAS